MSLPLVAIPPPRRQTLFDAALTARRALGVLEAPGAGPSEEEIDLARYRVLAQLASVAECIEAMADTGLLHTGLDARHTMQTSAYQPHANGEWVAETFVTRVPPRPLLAAKWSYGLCSAAMTASVVLNVVARDHRGELVEYRQLAALIADAWPAADRELSDLFVAEWEQRHERDGAGECGDPLDTSPWGVAVHRVHDSLCVVARDCRPPAAAEVGAIHALDFARRTLQWVGSTSVGELGGPLGEEPDA